LASSAAEPVAQTLARFPLLLGTLESVHLVEASPGLMALQASALGGALDAAGVPMRAAGEEVPAGAPRGVETEWFARVEQVPLQPDVWTMGVAHEFFDALPIHIFEKTAKGFREVLVDIERAPQGQSGV
jgi:SAM-dependent MidA family methyltransferase